jgi:hypothetical protein
VDDGPGVADLVGRIVAEGQNEGEGVLPGSVDVKVFLVRGCTTGWNTEEREGQKRGEGTRKRSCLGPCTVVDHTSACQMGTMDDCQPE